MGATKGERERESATGGIGGFVSRSFADLSYYAKIEENFYNLS